MAASDEATSPGVIAITGGTRGIGRAIALRLAQAGQPVVLGFRSDAARAAETVAEIRAAGGVAEAVPVEITDAASLDAFFAAAAALGPLRGVVAGAGAVRGVGSLADLDPGTVRRDLEVTLAGPVLTSRAAIPRLTGAGGSIVLIGSAASTLGRPGVYVHYAAAKAGVAAFTAGLAQEVASLGIRVNCVEPGIIRTEFHADPDRPVKLASTIPIGRAGEPDDIAGAVAWLLSPDAGYTTGAVLRVAGGI